MFLLRVPAQRGRGIASPKSIRLLLKKHFLTPLQLQMSQQLEQWGEAVGKQFEFGPRVTMNAVNKSLSD